MTNKKVVILFVTEDILYSAVSQRCQIKIVRPSPYVHNTRPCYVKSVSVCIIVYIYFDSHDMPTTIQTEMDFTWKPYRSLKGGVCY